MVNKVVFIRTTTDKESPGLVLPLVLQVGTVDVNCLICRCIALSKRGILHIIKVILYTSSKLGRKEEHLWTAVHILRTTYGSKAVSFSVSVRVHVAAIVAVTLNILSRSVDAISVASVGSCTLKGYASAVDNVVGCLSNVSLVWWNVKLVTTTAILLSAVILKG